MTRRSRLQTLIVALAAFALSATAAAEGEAPSPPAVLTVDVSNIQNDKGQIGCSLYSKEEGFPSKTKKADAVMFVKSNSLRVQKPEGWQIRGLCHARRR